MRLGRVLRNGGRLPHRLGPGSGTERRVAGRLDLVCKLPQLFLLGLAHDEQPLVAGVLVELPVDVVDLAGDLLLPLDESRLLLPGGRSGLGGQ